MLTSLDIRDLALIDRVELSFGPGLAVLTGETGAGKSILLDSLGFVLGWRGRAEMVRAGAAEGEATAVFDLGPTHPARAVLAEAGLPIEDELVLRRVNTAEGRKSAWVNGRRVSGEVLRQLSDTLVELHGQQDDRGLLNPRGHRQLLDEFGDLSASLDAVRSAWAARGAARKALAEAEAALEKARADEEFLRHAAAELDKLKPQPGEEAELDAKRRKMQAAAKIGADIARAHQALGQDGAEAPMADALRWLESVAPSAEGLLDAALSALSRALDELGQAEQEVASALETLEFDPRELERIEERLFALRAAARKHNLLPEALPTLAEEFRERIKRLDAGTGALKALNAAVASADAAYATAAEALTEARRVAASRLDAAMAKELPPLKMERAVFTTAVTAAAPGPEGQDDVTFTVATNPGAPAGALNKIASGGELSRFLLALKVCLSGRSDGLTLIFDEIDRGVGGATADAVGRRLEALAAGGQVLVVTHAPQVAARAARHFLVAKSVSDGVTRSQVRALEGSERTEEIARMLAGDTVTEAARAAARELIGS